MEILFHECFSLWEKEIKSPDYSIHGSPVVCLKAKDINIRVCREKLCPVHNFIASQQPPELVKLVVTELIVLFPIALDIHVKTSQLSRKSIRQVIGANVFPQLSHRCP